jgi:hypothetical protein
MRLKIKNRFAAFKNRTIAPLPKGYGEGITEKITVSYKESLGYYE